MHIFGNTMHFMVLTVFLYGYFCHQDNGNGRLSVGEFATGLLQVICHAQTAIACTVQSFPRLLT
jgi:hypothetical protein